MKIVFWFGLLILSTNGTARDSETLGNLLKAKYALAINEYTEAHSFVQAAKMITPYETEAYFLEIQVVLEQLKANQLPGHGLEDELLDLHRQAIELFPRDYRFYMSLGKFLSTGQRWTRSPDFENPGIYLSQALSLMDAEVPDFEKAETEYQLGLWLLAQEKPFESSEHLVKVSSRENTIPWALYYAGQALEASGQYLAAIAFLEEYQRRGLRDIGISKRPLNLSLSILKQITEPNSNNLETLMGALEQEGGASYLYYDTALRFFRLERRQTAIDVLENQQKKEPLDSQSLSLLLRCKMESHSYEQVLQSASSALSGELDPRARRVWIDYGGEAAFLLGDRDFLGNLFHSYGKQADVADRLFLLRAFQNSLWDNDQELLMKYLEEGKNQSFIGYLRGEMEIKGIKVPVVENAVQFFQARMDWQGSIRFLEQQLELGLPTRFLCDDLADAFALAGKFENAFSWYKKSLEKEPDRADMLNNYGYFLTNAGIDFDLAKVLIEKAIVLEPNTPAYLDSLAWACFAQGDNLEAESYLLKALEIDPDHPEKLDHLGDVQLALGNLPKARELWSRAIQQLQTQSYNLGEARISAMIKKLAEASLAMKAQIQ